MPRPSPACHRAADFANSPAPGATARLLGHWTTHAGHFRWVSTLELFQVGSQLLGVAAYDFDAQGTALGNTLLATYEGASVNFDGELAAADLADGTFAVLVNQTVNGDAGTLFFQFAADGGVSRRALADVWTTGPELAPTINGVVVIAPSYGPDFRSTFVTVSSLSFSGAQLHQTVLAQTSTCTAVPTVAPVADTELDLVCVTEGMTGLVRVDRALTGTNPVEVARSDGGFVIVGGIRGSPGLLAVAALRESFSTFAALEDVYWLRGQSLVPLAFSARAPVALGRWSDDSGVVSWLEPDAGLYRFHETCLPP